MHGNERCANRRNAENHQQVEIFVVLVENFLVAVQDAEEEDNNKGKGQDCIPGPEQGQRPVVAYANVIFSLV